MKQICKTLRLDEASDGFLCFHSVLHILVPHDLIQAVKANSRECKEGASDFSPRSWPMPSTSYSPEEAQRPESQKVP